MNRARAVVLIGALLLPGCAAQRVPVHWWPPDSVVLPLLGGEEPVEEEPEWRQYVVLLPDEDGTVGAIEVTRDGESALLDSAYEAVSFDDLSDIRTVEVDGLELGFSPAIEHEPPAPTDWTVLFELGTTRLAGGADGAMDELLEDLRQRATAAIRVAGHTDTSGTETLNDGLSRRRAEAVRDRLIEAGVPAAAIAIEAFGESQPAVPTGDGVREPRNRRVVVRVR